MPVAFLIPETQENSLLGPFGNLCLQHALSNR